MLGTQYASAQNHKTFNRYYQLPEGIQTDEYMQQTVTFKLKEAYRHDLVNGEANIPVLARLFSDIGAYDIDRRFPSAERPVEEKNKQGQAYADLTLIYELHYSEDYGVDEVVNRLYHLGLVQYAEPHFIDNIDFNVDDPNLSQQWHINKISAPDAWDLATGSTDIVIAIVDSGTDEQHEDLEPVHAWNMDDPVNGTDDDGDGYIDNNLGWDFVDEDNSPQYAGSNHGVHVSGCAAPATNNGLGVAGAGFGCLLLPIRVGDATIPFGYEGITYAADHGADIINCSWGGTNFSSAGQDVVTYATINKGALVVAAAGNDAIETAHYPSSLDWVFSVASTDITDSKSSFSSYHSTVDVSAPGTNIYATYPNNTYGFNSGTSMASPVAAGAAGLVKSKYPFLSGLQIGEMLRINADDIYGAGANSFYTGMLGSGRINLEQSVGPINGPSVQLSSRTDFDGNDGAYVVGDTVSIVGNFTNYLLPTATCDITLSTNSPYVTVVDDVASLGVISTNQSAENDAQPFRIVILPGTPLNESATFTVDLTDGTYSNSYSFNLTLNVDYVNIRVNEVHTSITSKGIIGFNDFSTQNEGLGFRYIPGGGENLLFDGGLMIGAEKDGQTLVSDHVRGEGTDVDMEFASVINVAEASVPTVANIDVSGSFGDQVAAQPLDVRVNHRAHAWDTPGHTKYVLVEYTIINEGTSDLTKLYAGIFCDWDIQAFDNNKAATDVERQLGYCYNTDVGGFYAGVQVLSDGPFIHYAVDHVAGGNGGADLSGGYTTAQKYQTMSETRETAGPGTGNDVFNVVSTGPYDLAPNDSVTVTFALVAGESLEDLLEASDSSYTQVVGTPPPPAGVTSRMADVLDMRMVPNPANHSTRVVLPGAEFEQVNITVTDLTGNVVWRTNSTATNSIEIPTTELAAGAYLVRVSAGQNTATRKLIVAR